MLNEQTLQTLSTPSNSSAWPVALVTRSLIPHPAISRQEFFGLIVEDENLPR